MLKIIVVDDEDLIRMGLVKMLTDAGAGYMVVGSYSDGDTAINAILNSDADVVITDIRMPDLDGLQLVKSIYELNKNISIIVLSGYRDFEYAQALINYRIVKYLLKPINQNELFKCLDKIAETKGISTGGDTDAAGSKRVVEQVKQIIKEEYAQELNLNLLSQRVFLNPKYLSRMFKKETGINITDYQIYIRMEKAKHLLKENQGMKVYEIAAFVGYSDSVFFSKLFKRLMGVTPMEYRNQKIL